MNFRDRLAFLISDKTPIEKEAPKMSQRMDMLSLPEPPNKKDADYLDAMRGWVFRAVGAIAQEVAKIDLVLYQRKGKNVEEIDEHEALDVLDRVNGFQTKYDFLEATQSYLELVGETFWYKSRVSENKPPTELWILRPDWVKVLPPTGKEDFIGGYSYKVPGSSEEAKYPVKDIVHFKYFDPKNPYRGMGPLQAAAYAYDTDFFSAKWNRNFFYNNAMPSIVLRTEQSLKEKEIKRIKSEWKNQFGGINKAHKFAILTGGLEIDTALKQTFKDMEFLEQRKFSRDEIFTIFQVPKTIVTITEDVNLANAKEHRAVFLENVIKPKMTKLVSFLNEFYLPDWGDDLYFGYRDPTPNDSELSIKVSKDGADVLTVNERRELLGFEPIKEGEVIRVPFSVISETVGGKEKVYKEKKVSLKNPPAFDKGVIVHHRRTAMEILRGKIKKQLEESGVKEQLQQFVYLLMSKKPERLEERKKAEDEEGYRFIARDKAETFWKQMLVRSEPQELSYKSLLRKYWKRQKEEILDKVGGIKAIKMVKNVDRYLFDIEQENKILIELVYPLVNRITAQAGEDALKLLGIDEKFNLTDEIINILEKYNLKLAGSVNETTYGDLRKALQDGIANDESITDIRKRIEDVFKQASRSRAETIARTETIRVNNMGHVAGYKQSGVVQFKEWLVALDERTCEFCLQMEKEYRVRSLDEDFLKEGDELRGINGGVMSIDYSNIGEPPLHANCRCTILPVVKVR